MDNPAAKESVPISSVGRANRTRAGVTLIADGMGYHVPKGYIYAAMGFSALVESLNMLARRRKAK